MIGPLLPLAVDEDFNNDVLRGVRRRLPSADMIRAQDTGHANVCDASVLAWAASEGRVLVTHDKSTMTAAAIDRITSCDSMPGLIVVHQRIPVGRVIDDIVLIVECSKPADWIDQIVFLPL